MDTNLLNNDFVRAMSDHGRKLWQYIILNVDLGGFIHLQFEDINHQCQFIWNNERVKLTPEEIIKIMKEEHGERLSYGETTIEKHNRVWLKDHILFQKNFPLNALNSAHKSIMSSLLDNLELYVHDNYFRYIFSITQMVDMLDENGSLKKFIPKDEALKHIGKQKTTKAKLNPTMEIAIPVLPGVEIPEIKAVAELNARKKNK